MSTPRADVRVEEFSAPLIAWFVKNRRPLVFRQSLASLGKENRGEAGRKETPQEAAYRVLVSEIMLQQTRIETVTPYYIRFMEAFPTVEDLAKAQEEDVLKHWQGLGYYSRARHLHEAAKQVVEAGGFPTTQEGLERLKGVGPYTAGAIAAMAFGEPACAVDGNVLRVCARYFLVEDNVLTSAAKAKVTKILQEVYPKDQSALFTEGLMELGETICLPSSPLCRRCPLNQTCGALREGRVDSLPVRVKKVNRTIEDRMVLIIQRGDEILVARRPEGKVLAGLDEFPNILLQDSDLKESLMGEALDEGTVLPAAKRDKWRGAFKKAYGVPMEPVRFIRKTKHVFSHLTWNLYVFEGKAEIMEDLLEEKGMGLRFAKNEDAVLPAAFRKLIE